MKRLATLCAIVALSLGGITACGSGGISINSGPQQTAAQPAPTATQECGFTWDSCGPSAPPSQPVQSADAKPVRNPTCELTYDVPRLVPDGIRGFFTIRCKILPTIMLVTAKVQFKNSAGNWVDQGGLFVYNYPDPQRPLFIDTPRGFEWFEPCLKGTKDLWRLAGHWSGLKGDGTPFPNVAEGDTPADWTSDVVTIKC